MRAEVLRICALVTNRPPIGPTRNTKATTVHINLSQTQVCDSGECSVFLRSYYELTRQYISEVCQQDIDPRFSDPHQDQGDLGLGMTGVTSWPTYDKQGDPGCTVVMREGFFISLDRLKSFKFPGLDTHCGVAARAPEGFKKEDIPSHWLRMQAIVYRYI